MYDNGVSYRWAIGKHLGGGKWSVYDRDGDAWCVKRTQKFNKCKTSFKFAQYDIKRTAVKGIMDNDNIAKTCAKKGMRPICPYYSYMDGTCILLQPYGSWFIAVAQANSFYYNDQVEDTYTYTGRLRTKGMTYHNTLWSNVWSANSARVRSERRHAVC